MPEPKSSYFREVKLMWLRRTVQIIVFLLFLVLIFQAVYSEKWDGLNPWFPPELLLQLDPVAMFGVALSEWRWVNHLLWVVPLLVVTAVFGRIFCGWMCPLGTTLDAFERVCRSKMPVQRQKGPVYESSGSRILSAATLRSKYYILIALAIAAVLGVQAFWALDPIPIVTRSYATAVFPAVEWSLRLARTPMLEWGWAEQSYYWMEENLLSFNQPRFQHSGAVWLIFIAILLLSLDGRRWWCRRLCPLGAFLGLLSWAKPVRIQTASACAGCGECATHCKMEAIQITHREPGKAVVSIDNRECILCSTCIEQCPKEILGYRWGGPKEQAETVVDLPRRRLLAALGVGAVTAPVLALEMPRTNENKAVIRPPGIGPEEEFLNRCIRCGECMKVCPNGALHPALFETGPSGVFAPMMIPRLGYCSYDCNLCSQVCPTGAIPYFTPEHKHARSQGFASFNTNKCIPYRERRDCLVCEEHCPTSPKAIQYRERETVGFDGETKVLKYPYVRVDRCVGCGVCENKCPVSGESAVVVTAYRPQKKLEEVRAELAAPVGGSNPWGGGGHSF
jgi:MauM/NapG family ferredoxin protein